MEKEITFKAPTKEPRLSEAVGFTLMGLTSEMLVWKFIGFLPVKLRSVAVRAWHSHGRSRGYFCAIQGLNVKIM